MQFHRSFIQNIKGKLSNMPFHVCTVPCQNFAQLQHRIPVPVVFVARTMVAGIEKAIQQLRACTDLGVKERCAMVIPIIKELFQEFEEKEIIGTQEFLRQLMDAEWFNHGNQSSRTRAEALARELILRRTVFDACVKRLLLHIFFAESISIEICEQRRALVSCTSLCATLSAQSTSREHCKVIHVNNCNFKYKAFSNHFAHKVLCARCARNDTLHTHFNCATLLA